MELHVRSICKKCDGTGAIEHPKWTVFYFADKVYKEKNKKFMSTEQVSAWWLEKYDESNFGKIPEEINCPICDGHGKVEEWITAEQFLETYPK